MGGIGEWVGWEKGWGRLTYDLIKLVANGVP